MALDVAWHGDIVVEVDDNESTVCVISSNNALCVCIIVTDNAKSMHYQYLDC